MGGMTVPDSSAANPEYLASVKQARQRALLFAVTALVVLIIGAILVADVTRVASIIGLSVLGWAIVQLIGIGYLRMRPKNPAVGVAIVGGIATALTVLLITFFSSGFDEALLVAGTWLAGGALSEAVRGSRWQRALGEKGISGDVVRTLAIHTGYDGTPLSSFLTGGILVGIWAWLLDVLPWVTPFAALVHCTVALGLSAKAKV